jgi:fatty-acyl-CoA synthase
LVKGDRVALILPDNADFVFAFLGAIRAGIVPVPIYPPTGLGKLSGYLENTLHIVERSGAKMLITSGEIRRLLGTVQSRASDLTRVYDVDTLKAMREELKPVSIGLDDVCFLQFTSGSTSKPKGVILTHANLAANVHSIMDLGLRVQTFDTGVSWLPLYHDMGLIGFVIAPLYHVNSITFLPPLLFLKRPAKWLEQISKRKASISFGPNFAYALCVKRVKDSEMEGLDLSSWRVAGCGSPRSSELWASRPKRSPAATGWRRQPWRFRSAPLAPGSRWTESMAMRCGPKGRPSSSMSRTRTLRVSSRVGRSSRVTR